MFVCHFILYWRNIWYVSNLSFPYSKPVFQPLVASERSLANIPSWYGNCYFVLNDENNFGSVKIHVWFSIFPLSFWISPAVHSIPWSLGLFCFVFYVWNLSASRAVYYLYLSVQWEVGVLSLGLHSCVLTCPLKPSYCQFSINMHWKHLQDRQRNPDALQGWIPVQNIIHVSVLQNNKSVMPMPGSIITQFLWSVCSIL